MSKPILLPRCQAALDLHSGGTASEYLPCAYVYAGGPMAAAKAALADAFGAPLAVVVGATAETRSLSAACERQGVPMIATELGGGGFVSAAALAVADSGTRAVLRHLGLLPAMPGDDQRRTRSVQVPDRSHFLMCPATGLFEPMAALGDKVEPGTPAGWLHDVDDPCRAAGVRAVRQCGHGRGAAPAGADAAGRLSVHHRGPPGNHMNAPIPRPELARIGGPMAAIPELSIPGVQRLCSNESPLGPSPLAIAAASAALARGHEYPEGEGGGLLAAMSAHFGVPAERIRLGAGSDTLVMNVVLAFAGRGDELVFSARGYARYARNALIAGATPVAAPDSDFRADPAAILAAVTPRTRLVMLANPDNPSGAMLTLAEIETLHAQLPSNVLLLLDCAYAEYVRDPAYGDGGLALSARADNVVVSRTFSKLFGMAGIRLGWLTGSPAILDAVAKVGPTFPVSVPALAAGRAALADTAHQHAARAHNDQWLPWLASELGRSNRLHLYPSQANFQLIDFPDPETAQRCTAHLAAHGVLVRRFGPGAHARQMRISIGSGAALARAVSLITAFLDQGG